MTATRRLLLLAFGFAVASPAWAAVPKTAALLSGAREPVRIVCIGDSITGVYYHTGGLRAYPEMLEIALRRLYPGAQVTVRNAGISGDTTRGGLFRLQRDVLAHRPHLVTLMFGMNDLVRVPAIEFKRNLTDMALLCRQAGAEVLLCTQNSVMETAARPRGRLAEFTEAIRSVGREASLDVVDAQALFEAVRERDELEWSLLLSDEIHPNMDGHKLFASAIARAISGREVSLGDVGPAEPLLGHTLGLLRAGKPVRVLAMPPLDAVIGPAIERHFAGAKVTVMSWPVEGRTLAQVEADARKVRKMGVDLVLLAVPVSAAAATFREFHRRYSWIMNWSLSYGRREWDVIAVPPSTVEDGLGDAGRRHEEFARRLIRAQDLGTIERAQGDTRPLADRIASWFSELAGGGSGASTESR